MTPPTNPRRWRARRLSDAPRLADTNRPLDPRKHLLAATEGWTPIPRLKPAPQGWRFWTTNKTWDIAARKYYAPLQGWMRASNIAGVACAVALVGATVLQLTILTLAAMLFLVIGLVCLIVFRARKQRMTTELFAHVRTGAERARNERLARDYHRYILGAS